MAYIDNVNKVLNIQPEAAPTRVRLSQNENGRNLYFTLAGNENPIPSGVTVTISGTKPDGTVYSGTGSISNDVVLIPETVQLTAVAGVWDAKVKITSGGNTVATGRIRFLIDADTVAPGSVPSSSVLEGLVEQAQQYAETARQEAYGSPLTATTVAGMTDHTRVYVYTGSESGKTAGHWYYWNGSAWTDGGVYNSTAVQTDKTLSLMDVPADAKAVGDAIATDKTLSIADAPADAQTVGLKFSYIRDMIAGVETTTIATKSYSIGDLIIVRINDTLYEVTKAITTGTQIKSANARVTTIDEVVKSRIAGSVDNTLTQTGKAADAKVVGDELTSLKGDLSYVYDEKALFVGDWKIGFIGGSVGSEIQFNPAFTNRVSLTTPQFFDYAITAYIQAGYKATFYFLDSNNVILAIKYVNENSTITIDPETNFEILIEKIPVEAVDDKIDKYIQAVSRTMHSYLLYEAVDNANAEIRSNQLALENLYFGAMYFPDMAVGSINPSTGAYIPSTKYHIATPEWFVPEYPYAVKTTNENYLCRLIYNDNGAISYEELNTNGNVLFPGRQTKIDLWKNNSVDELELVAAKNIISIQSIDDYLSKKANLRAEKIENGFVVFDGFIRRGGLASDSGQYLGYVKYRCATPNITQYEKKVTIQAKNGFHFGVMLFNSDDEFVSDLGWKTSYTFSAGQKFKIVIARITEDTTEYADANEFLSKLDCQYEVESGNDSTSLLSRNMFSIGRPKLAAHAGYHVNYPENTIPAFEQAGKNGYWAIESDVQKTRDGYYIMMHDTTVDRTTNGSGNIADMNLAEIRALHIKNHDNLLVPTLDEYLGICKHYGCIPMIEIKSTISGMEECKKLIDFVKSYGFTGENVMFSGSKYLLDAFRKADATMPFACIYQSGFSHDWDTELAFCSEYDNVCIHWDILAGFNSQMCKEAHDYGIPIVAFITDTINDVTSAFLNGADCCTTNVVLPSD